MSVRSFHSVFMVGGVAAAALSCYLVSLRVASERAALENVETEIVLAQRDIRLLQTEIGTRGRLAQLERWNVKVLALSAPSADQFVPDSFQLASLVTPEQKPAVEAPLVYASAPATEKPVLPVAEEQESASAPAPKLMHEAGLKVPAPASAAKKPSPPKAAPKAPLIAKAATPSTKVAAAAKPKPKPESGDKPALKMANRDPLAPLPAETKKKKAAPAAKASTGSTSKDSGKTR